VDTNLFSPTSPLIIAYLITALFTIVAPEALLTLPGNRSRYTLLEQENLLSITWASKYNWSLRYCSLNIICLSLSPLNFYSAVPDYLWRFPENSSHYLLRTVVYSVYFIIIVFTWFMALPSEQSWAHTHLWFVGHHVRLSQHKPRKRPDAYFSHATKLKTQVWVQGHHTRQQCHWDVWWWPS
jgi:hypothetical protein